MLFFLEFICSIILCVYIQSWLTRSAISKLSWVERKNSFGVLLHSLETFYTVLFYMYFLISKRTHQWVVIPPVMNSEVGPLKCPTPRKIWCFVSGNGFKVHPPRNCKIPCWMNMSGFNAVCCCTLTACESLG